MEIGELTRLFNAISVVLAFVAAGCWFYSAIVRVKPDEEERDEHGMHPAVIESNGEDVLKSFRAQSKWSAIAAVFAGIAALSQGLALLG